MGKSDDCESQEYAGKSFGFASEIGIELWEHDKNDPNDRMDARKITVSDAGLGKREVNVSGGGASYDMRHIVEP